MAGADIGVGWIDQTGTVQFQVCEQDGWTAIQFRRLLKTCDSMDVPIKVNEKLFVDLTAE